MKHSMIRQSFISSERRDLGDIPFLDILSAPRKKFYTEDTDSKYGRTKDRKNDFKLKIKPAGVGRPLARGPPGGEGNAAASLPSPPRAAPGSAQTGKAGPVH